MPHRQPLLSGSAATATAPGKKTEKTTLLAGSPVSECTRRERQERNQSSVEERERQRNREGTGEPDRIWLHQWDQRLLSVR